jgi:hypothetical protein
MSAPPPSHPLEDVPKLVADLYRVVGELETKFGRKFTPDGHLVGSLGEVIAAHRYGLTLRPQSAKGFDAFSASGLKVEIKATQSNSGVALRHPPEHLIVLQLHRDGKATEVYNGPGEPVWLAAGVMQTNGQRSITLSKLRLLQSGISSAHVLPTIAAT